MDDDQEYTYFQRALTMFATEKKSPYYIGQKVVAANAKVKVSAVSKAASGTESRLKLETRKKYARACGYSYKDFIKLGQGIDQISDDHPNQTFIIQTLSDRHAEHIDTDHFRAVPLYESGRLAAWSGGAVYSEYETPDNFVMVYLPELQGHAKHNLVAMRVGGSSMQPTIPERAIIIIDTHDREFADGRIFAVRWLDNGDDTIAVKRIIEVKDHKGFVLQSDNRSTKPEYTGQDWDRLVFGRVIWIWHSVLEA